IGGSYRLPEVMTASGVKLREVGTTNKTRIQDYEQAIGEDTAAILRCHTSNYRVVGFTEETPLTELVALGHRRQIPVIDDIGSGALVDLAKYGVTGEPLAAASIRAGADLVLFSGDKLLGGPQVGVIAGRQSWIEKINRHPLMRALRVDKLTLASLGATLRLYRDEQAAETHIPLLMLLATSTDNLKYRAERIALQLTATPTVAKAEAMADHTYLGGGSVPMQQIPTWCIAITPAEGQTAETLARMLRTGDPSIMGRIHQNRLMLDLRSVFPHQDMLLVQACERLGTPAAPPAR
ncbi:MAG: L-seryl-tRNA(Sec) selenium transferase, partial [Pirellulaceae bacterium]